MFKVIDENELIKFIKDKTQLSDEIIIKVLDSEMDFLEKKKIVKKSSFLNSTNQ